MSIASVGSENDRIRGPLLEALAGANLGVAPNELELVVEDALRLRRSLAALSPAMQKLPQVPAGLARIAQATENAWRRIEDEFGLLQSTAVATLIGSKTPNRNLANSLRQEGGLLGVKRLNSYRYPGFQFTGRGEVRAVIPALIAAASEIGWPQDELILWLCAPSGTFGGERPVDHLDEPGFVERARDTATVDW